MRSFQVVGGYFSSVKKKVINKTQSIWQRDDVQAIYQGFTAPFYSRASFKNLVSSSEDLQTSLSRAVTENGTFALRALILYFIYYRMVNPTLKEYREDLDSTSWVGSTLQWNIFAIDLSLYLVMIGYLKVKGIESAAQNILLSSTITTTAGNAMKPSKDFKPCDPEKCGVVPMARAGIDSAFFYLANRYVVNDVSRTITNNVPGYWGLGLSGFVEAVSIGLPLVEYKFSAAGQCTWDKYAEMLSSYKTYCFFYGVSFVVVTWSSNKILSTISGEKNPYIYDAVFSLVFQMYALLAIAREKKFPGNDQVTFNALEWITYFAEKPLTKFLLKKLLGSLYSVEDFVQSPGAGIALSVYDNEIKQGINSVRGGIQQARNIQNNRLVTTLRWVNTWFPYQFIPDKVTTACKSVSKTAISRSIRRVEYLLDVGRNAELQRNAVGQPTVETIGNHFVPSNLRLEQKVAQIDEIKSTPMLRVEEPYVSRAQVVTNIEEKKSQVAPEQIEFKADVPAIKDKAAEQKFDAILRAQNIDSHYFVESKEPAKKMSVVPVSLNSSTLFAKKDGDILHRSNQNMLRRQDPHASVAASIASSAVRIRASR